MHKAKILVTATWLATHRGTEPWTIDDGIPTQQESKL